MGNFALDIDVLRSHFWLLWLFLNLKIAKLTAQIAIVSFKVVFLKFSLKYFIQIGFFLIFDLFDSFIDVCNDLYFIAEIFSKVLVING